MFNLYRITKEIHGLLPKVEEAKNVKFEIRFEKFIDGRLQGYIEGDYYAGHSDQASLFELRQILKALEGVLGKGKMCLDLEIIEYEDQLPEMTQKEFNYWHDHSWVDIVRVGYKPYWETKAEAPCQKWLDGLDPLFDREPETVLTELRNVLKTLI